MEISNEPILGSSSKAEQPFCINSGCQTGWVVKSRGLRGVAKPGSAARMAVSASADRGGTGRPISSQKSRAIAQNAPEKVRMPGPQGMGLG